MTLQRTRALAVAVALAVGAGTLAGCAAARNELGTANSECYVDVAPALTAVHHRGRLHGVRLVTVASLRPHATLLYHAARTEAHPSAQVCLLAFGGTFHSSDVSRPLGRHTGPIAVVELTYPGKRLVATLLARRAPLPFGHPHF